MLARLGYPLVGMFGIACGVQPQHHASVEPDCIQARWSSFVCS
jgi:hypothetical protein